MNYIKNKKFNIVCVFGNCTYIFIDSRFRMEFCIAKFIERCFYYNSIMVFIFKCHCYLANEDDAHNLNPKCHWVEGIPKKFGNTKFLKKSLKSLEVLMHCTFQMFFCKNTILI